jgi:hypothetical protein
MVCVTWYFILCVVFVFVFCDAASLKRFAANLVGRAGTADRLSAHRPVSLQPELFAEGGVGGAGRVLGVDGELEFSAAADLGALGGF